MQWLWIFTQRNWVKHEEELGFHMTLEQVFSPLVSFKRPQFYPRILTDGPGFFKWDIFQLQISNINPVLVKITHEILEPMENLCEN